MCDSARKKCDNAHLCTWVNLAFFLISNRLTFWHSFCGILIKTVLNYIYIYIGLKTILEMNINHIKEK